jgi:2-C-methyl-D-erythritol 4-phosphate cytidylyltransferase
MSVVALVPGEWCGRSGGNGAAYSSTVDHLMASGVVQRARVVVGSLTRAVADELAGQPDTQVVLLHDGSVVPDALLARVVAQVLERGLPVVPVLPCSDTVKQVDADDVVLSTPDRAMLRVLGRPIGFPASFLRDRPDVDLADSSLLTGAVTISVSMTDGGPE